MEEKTIELEDIDEIDEYIEEIEKEIDEEIKNFEETEENLCDGVQYYLKKASKYRLLEEEEKIKLVNEYKKTHNIDIRNKLINHNLRLSVFIAKRFVNVCQSMTLLDLIQECNITLIDSIDKFDPQKNTKFSTYVVKAMKRNLQRDIDNKDRIIRKPINVEVINFNYKRYMQDY